MLRYLCSCVALALLAACSAPPTLSQSLKGTLATSHGSDLYSVDFSWSTHHPSKSELLRCRFDAQSDGHWEYDGPCPTSARPEAGLEYTYAQFGRYTATFETFSATDGTSPGSDALCRSRR